MKTLTEIQTELRSLSNQITALSNEIEEHKSADGSNESGLFDQLENIAKNYPVHNNELEGASDITKKCYFQFLVILANIKSNNLTEKLLFIQRIVQGISYEKEIKEIIKDGMDINADFINDLVEYIGHLKYSLLLDGLILSNITETASDEELKVITDIVDILNFDEKDLILISKLASAIVQNDIDIFNSIAYTQNCKSSENLSYIIPRSWIIKYRKYCGEYPKTVCESKSPTATSELNSIFKMLRIYDKNLDIQVKYKVNINDFVKKDDKIVEYEGADPLTFEVKQKTITAPCNGKVFMGEVKKKNDPLGVIETYIEVYIVSCFDDYDDFCKWLKTEKE